MPRTQWADLTTGVRLPYREHGEHHTVPWLFLHGYGDSLRFFDPLLPHLPAGIRAVCVTQRGHGDADKPASGYALQDFADDVAAFLDTLGVASAVIVGHSSGGYVAQRFAADHPGRVSGLCLIGSPFSLQHRTAPFADAVAALRDPVAIDAVRAILGTVPTVRELPQAFLDEMLGESAKMPARVWRAVLAGLTDALPPAARAGAITAPTLILCGDRDEILAAAEQRELRDAIPHSELITIRDAGHLVVWDQPGAVGRALAEWAERTTAESGP